MKRIMLLSFFCFLGSTVFASNNTERHSEVKDLGENIAVIENEPAFSLCWTGYRESVTCNDGAQMFSAYIDISYNCETGEVHGVFGGFFSDEEACEGHGGVNNGCCWA